MPQPKPHTSPLSKLRKKLPVLLACSTRAVGGSLQWREPPAPKRVAITEWNSLEQAQAFYNSAAWKDLAPQREKGSKTIRRYIVEATN